MSSLSEILCGTDLPQTNGESLSGTYDILDSAVLFEAVPDQTQDLIKLLSAGISHHQVAFLSLDGEMFHAGIFSSEYYAPTNDATPFVVLSVGGIQLILKSVVLHHPG